MMIFWQMGRHGVSLVIYIKVEILKGIIFLVVAGESAKSTKIFPLPNFLLYGNGSCRQSGKINEQIAS